MKRQVSMNSFLIGIKGEKSIENHQGNQKKKSSSQEWFYWGVPSRHSATPSKRALDALFRGKLGVSP